MKNVFKSLFNKGKKNRDPNFFVLVVSLQWHWHGFLCRAAAFFGRNVFCLLLLHLDVWPSLCRKMFVQNVWLQKAVFTSICWGEGSISVLTLNLGFILDYCVTSQLVGGPKNATYTYTSFKWISNKSLGLFAYSKLPDFLYVHLSLRNFEYISFFFCLFFFGGGGGGALCLSPKGFLSWICPFTFGCGNEIF